MHGHMAQSVSALCFSAQMVRSRPRSRRMTRQRCCNMVSTSCHIFWRFFNRNMQNLPLKSALFIERTPERRLQNTGFRMPIAHPLVPTPSNTESIYTIPNPAIDPCLLLGVIPDRPAIVPGLHVGLPALGTHFLHLIRKPFSLDFWVVLFSNRMRQN